jgi:integrase
LLEAGVGIHEVREWLGHRDISTTGRYLAITGASLQRALTRLEEARKAPAKKSRTKPRRPPTGPRPHGGDNVTVN